MSLSSNVIQKAMDIRTNTTKTLEISPCYQLKNPLLMLKMYVVFKAGERVSHYKKERRQRHEASMFTVNQTNALRMLHNTP